MNAVKQQTIARAAATLTAIGLLATASGAIGPLLPKLTDTQSRLYYPLLVYAAAFVLPFGAMMGVLALDLGPDLQSALVARLKTTEGHQDAVSPGLQTLFVENIEQCLREIDRAKTALVLGGGLLVYHAFLIISFSLMSAKLQLPIYVRNLVGSDISDFAADYDVGGILFLIFVVCDSLSYRKSRRQKKTAHVHVTKAIVKDRKI
ncbi:MAG: hypothetical protein ABSC06_19385 [Rhodopila sp.]